MRWTALAPDDRGGAVLQFNVVDQNDEQVGTYVIHVPAIEHGTTDSLIAAGHRQMAAIAQQWHAGLLEMAVAYERRSAG